MIRGWHRGTCHLAHLEATSTRTRTRAFTVHAWRLVLKVATKPALSYLPLFGDKAPLQAEGGVFDHVAALCRRARCAAATRGRQRAATPPRLRPTQTDRQVRGSGQHYTGKWVTFGLQNKVQVCYIKNILWKIMTNAEIFIKIHTLKHKCISISKHFTTYTSSTSCYIWHTYI